MCADDRHMVALTWSAEELAAELGVSEWLVRDRLRQIPNLWLGQRLVFPKHAVNRWPAECEAPPLSRLAEHPPVGRTPRIGGSPCPTGRRERREGDRRSSRRSSVVTRSRWCSTRTDRSLRSAGRSGVNPGTLGNWVAAERVERGERSCLIADDRAELADLRAENKQLRMERDLLKRSLAFWVKETSTQ
jgi:hypothetical protein